MHTGRIIDRSDSGAEKNKLSDLEIISSVLIKDWSLSLGTGEETRPNRAVAVGEDGNAQFCISCGYRNGHPSYSNT